MQIYVQVYDNDGAFSVFEIIHPVSVLPDFSNFQTIMNKIISSDTYFRVNIILNQGSYLDSIQELQIISSLLNQNATSDKLDLIFNNYSTRFPQIYGPSTYTRVSIVIKI